MIRSRIRAARMETWTRVRAGGWRAALLASVLSTSGCLMPAPPELSDPERTRPYVHYLKVDPPLGEPIQVHLMDSSGVTEVPILLPFQSEDLGEDVVGYLHLIAQNDTPDLEDTFRSPPGEFSTVRNMRMEWNPKKSLDPGCYRLTATLAHASSFGAGGLVNDEDLDDAEQVSWLANVFDDASGPITLDECPRIGGVN